MNIKRLLVASLVIGILFIIFDMLTAVSTNPIFSSYSGLPIWKTPPNILAGLIFDLINGFILVAVYTIIYNGIPGLGWEKGLSYGMIVGLFRVVMVSFSTIVMYNIPLAMVITNLITGYIEVILLCIILAVIYEKFVSRSLLAV